MATLFHTSPTPITTIHAHGLFGRFLAFASRPYFMTPEGRGYVYVVEIDDADIADPWHFFLEESHYRLLAPLVREVQALLGVDEDTAEELLRERKDPWDYSDDVDDSFEMQRLIAEAGARLGYLATAQRDEQGTVYFVDASRVPMTLAERW